MTHSREKADGNHVPAVSPFRHELERIVARLVSAGLPSDDRLPLAVLRVGDAVRAGIAVPRPLLAALALPGVLAPVVAESVLEVAGWELAWLGPPLTPGLGEHLIRRRDELASLLVLARRVWLLHEDRDPPIELGALAGALRGVDARMRPLLAPTTVADALVDRGLDDGWYRDFEGTAEAEAELAAEDLAAAVARSDPWPPGRGAGSPESTLAYVAAGTGRALVEAWAGGSPDSGDDLVAAIDTALAAYEPVCFVARLWRRAHGRSSGVLRFRPVALAAADDVSSSSEQHTLGSFAPIEAEGSLEVSGQRIVLRVFAEHDAAVERVRLGDHEASQPPPGLPWTVEHPRYAGLATVRVRIFGGGHEIDEALPLTDA